MGTCFPDCNTTGSLAQSSNSLEKPHSKSEIVRVQKAIVGQRLLSWVI